MMTLTKLAAAAACGTLLVGGLTALPAHAEGEAPAGSVTLDLVYAGKQRQATVTGAATVADAITQLALKVDGNDLVSPAVTTTVTDGMRLQIDVVSTKTFKKNVTLKKKTVYYKTKKLYKGQKKVVRKGHNGKATRTYLTTTINGVASTKVVAQKVTKKVSNRKVKVGTKSTKGLNLARLSKWNKIAKCESGGRWHINTHNGYFGGLQFNLGTWRSVKGGQFAKYPHKATKAEQITVANRLYAKRGFKPWSCRHVL